MEEELSIERIIELEKDVSENNVILKGFYNAHELDYIHLGRSLRKEKIDEYLDFFKDMHENTDEYIFFQNMASYFNVTSDELIKRLEYLEKIREYQVSRRKIIPLLLNMKRIVKLEKGAYCGISLLHTLYMDDADFLYTKLAEKIPFSELQSNNCYSKQDFLIRQMAYYQVKRYLLYLYSKGDIDIKECSIIQEDVLAIENRHMVKKMNESRFL